MDSSWLQHAEGITGLVTAIGAIYLAQRKVSIKTAADQATELRQTAVDQATIIRDELTREKQRYEQKWFDCEQRDVRNQVKVGNLETRVDEIQIRLIDCERRHHLK